jgi:hypothetical protein
VVGSQDPAEPAPEKVAQKSAPSKQPGTAASPSRSSEFLSASAIEAVVGTFNAEPRWRAEVHRRLPNGRYILVIHPEGRGQDDAVASIDVDNYEVDEARWLREIPAREQDVILERIDRALWAAYDAENPPKDSDDSDEERVVSPSPLQEFIDLMERRTQVLGASPRDSRKADRGDGYGQIAAALKDLAEPSGIGADDLERWLESVQLGEAADAVSRLRSGEAKPVKDVMAALWDRVLDEVPVVDVEGRPGDLQITGAAIFGDGGNKFVLERHREGERYVLRRIRVRVHAEQGPPESWTTAFMDLAGSYMKDAPEGTAGTDGAELATRAWKSWTQDHVLPEFEDLEQAFRHRHAPSEFHELARDLVEQLADELVHIDDVTDRLRPGSVAHRSERGEAFLTELYDKLGSFHDDLLRAPRTLQDARVLLYWTAAMLDAPLCQGDVKQRATAAFEEAKRLFDKARQRIIEGQSVDAVRRLHAAMRRISAAAAEIARSCGEGQIDIGVTPPHLPVSTEDRAEIVGGRAEPRP